jgi:hypothetical protein
VAPDATKIKKAVMSLLTRNKPGGNTVAFLNKDKSDAGRSKQGALKAKEYL